MKISRDRRQKADDDEFGRSDRIGGDRQGKDGKWHDLTRSIGARNVPGAMVLVRAEYGLKTLVR
jgi:hypothetical protein